jgi:predicted O-methyltransferase YrrM
MSTDFLAFDNTIQSYLGKFYKETEVQKALREVTADMPESVMQISAGQAALMQFFAGLLEVRNYLEIGVFTGYSSLSMALAMPQDGRIVACDISREWTDIGREYWEKAGVSQMIDLHLAPAVNTLRELLKAGKTKAFDMIFIDADKENYELYYTLSKQLLHPKGLILIDNTLWSGKVADDSEKDPETVAIRNLNLRIQMDPEVDAYLLPLADGITLVRLKTTS